MMRLRCGAAADIVSRCAGEVCGETAGQHAATRSDICCNPRLIGLQRRATGISRVLPWTRGRESERSQMSRAPTDVARVALLWNVTVGGPDMPAVKPISRRRNAAADLEDAGFAGFSHAIAQLLRSTPGTIVDIIEELLTVNTSLKTPKGRGKKAKPKQMSAEDTEAHAHLLAQALEELRYEVDRNKKDAITQVQQLREYLLEAGQRPDIDPEGFLLVLQQFGVAKLDIGDELRDLAQHLLESMGDSIPDDEQPSMEEFAKGFSEIAKTLKDDPFAIHGMISEFTQTMPVELRSMLIATVLVQKKIPALSEAARHNPLPWEGLLVFHGCAPPSVDAIPVANPRGGCQIGGHRGMSRGAGAVRIAGPGRCGKRCRVWLLLIQKRRGAERTAERRQNRGALLEVQLSSGC